MTDTANISILRGAEEHIEGINRCVGAVARERRYIGLVDQPTLAQTQDFVRALMAAGGVQFVAVDRAGTVVGWCEVVRPRLEGFRHAGRLGMGLLPGVRGRGIGRRLAEAAIQAAFAEGMERIELDVFGSNAKAIALYEQLGFVREGVRRGGRKIDGQYDDVVFMALRSKSTAPDSGAHE